MQKIGLNKLKPSNVNLYNNLSQSKNLSIHDIKEISSLIVSCECLDLNLIKNTNKLRICLKLHIKIIYLKNNDSSLYVYKTSYINYESIDLPNILNGHYISDSKVLNKIKTNIHTENINTKILAPNIILSYFLILNITIPPTYYIAYNIDNGFGDNIFLSHIDGQVLTQKTFNQNTNCLDFKWSLNGDKIWFLAKKNNNYNIYSVESDSKNIEKIENLNNYQIINNFILLSKNELLIEYELHNKKNIYKYNIRNNNFIPLINESAICEKPYFDNKNKLIYFLMNNEKTKHLYSIDEKGSVDIIFSYVNTIDYYVSYYLNNVIVKVIKENRLTLFEINIDSKMITPINLNNDEIEDILDVKYLYDTEDKRQLLILTKNHSKNEIKNSILLYDLNKYTYESIFSSNIVKFDIDYENSMLFIVHKNFNLTYLDKLNLKPKNISNTLENILKLPALIKDINIKKVPYEK